MYVHEGFMSHEIALSSTCVAMQVFKQDPRLCPLCRQHIDLFFDVPE